MRPVTFTHIGAVSAEVTVPLASVPEEGPGAIVRRVYFSLSARHAGSRTDYWGLEFGTLDHSGALDVQGTRDTARQGWQSGLNFLDFSPQMRYAPGAVLAVRFRKNGLPAALAGVSIGLTFLEDHRG